MRIRTVEISVGFLMILGAVALMFLALKVSGLSRVGLMDKGAYKVTALFTNVGKLNVRSPVKIAGVEIGRVLSIDLDRTTYQAFVTLQINGSVNNLPLNSSASISSSGLLGDNFVELIPGFDTENLIDGSKIEVTYPATSLSSLITTFLGGKK
jgi:phospholipid/cholesterol/gamma-HCH transport system substrate-binding protein